MRTTLVAAVLFVVGCAPDLTVDPSAQVTCAKSADCPGGLRCLTGATDPQTGEALAGMCLRAGTACTQEQGDGFAPLADGVTCTASDGSDGVCRAGTCSASRCGDGVVWVGHEQCEPSLTTDGTCRSDCTKRVCGDTIVDFDLGEMCDDGPDNGSPTSTCSILCTTGCGDGFVERDELCDDHNTVSGDGCDANCTPTACGNGIVTPGEQCDDGNLTNGDGCDANCTPTGCGNGIVTAGEICDDGDLQSGDGCDRNCTPTGCGNGVLTSGEECDDGNLTSGDGCDANCRITGCDNGVVTAGEQCDDGNFISGDGCDINCTVSRCGNGITAGSELCDCGDGTVAAGPGCSGPNSDAPNATCRTNCKPGGCGDGILDTREECEAALPITAVCADGGYYSGGSPTCNAQTCRFAWEPACQGRCGDGIINGAELCEVLSDGSTIYVPSASCLTLDFDRGKPECASHLCSINVRGCGPASWSTQTVGLYDLHTVAGTGPSDVWAASASGFEPLQHFDGESWSAVSGSGARSTSLFTAASGDVVVGGLAGGFPFTVWRGGTQADIFTLGPGEQLEFNAMSGMNVPGGYSVLIADTRYPELTPEMWLYDGATPTPLTMPTLGGASVTAAWLDAPNDYYLGTSTSDVWHFDGVNWTNEANVGFNGSDFVQAFWGDRAGTLFVASFYGQLYERSGGVWSGVTSMPQGVAGLSGVSANEVYVIGNSNSDAVFRLSGGVVQQLPGTGSGGRMNAIYAADSQHIFAVGSDARVLEYMGYQWLPSVAFGASIASFASSAAFAMGTDLESFPDVRFADGTLDLTAVPTSGWPGFTFPSRAFLTSASTGYLGLGTQIYSWDGANVTSEIDLGPSARMRAMGGRSASDAYALVSLGTQGDLYHRDDTSWSLVGGAPADIGPVGWISMVVTATDVMLFDLQDSYARFDGVSWSTVSTGVTSDGQPLFGAAGITDPVSGALHVWAVGGGNGLYFDGVTWHTVIDRSPSTMLDVCAMSPTRAYAVGTAGLLLEWLDGDWWPIRSGTSETYQQVLCLPQAGTLILSTGTTVSVLQVPAEL